MTSIALRWATASLTLAVVACGGAEREILIASNPGQATVRLAGADLGLTPVTVKVAGETTFTVEKRGYVAQEVLITRRSGPNVVVELVKEPETSSSSGYTTMRQIKTAYRDGTISRADYDHYKGLINRRRAVDLEKAKRDFRAGRMTEGQYKQRVRAIKDRYEG
jgi:hypothetical protein